MKNQSDMIEGPQALTRFENTMKALFTKKKNQVIASKTKADSKKPSKTS